jgi:hypothetical protein
MYQYTIKAIWQTDERKQCSALTALFTLETSQNEAEIFQIGVGRRESFTERKKPQIKKKFCGQKKP